MASFIPNQPVSFGPDINSNPQCGMFLPRAYYQPVQFGDITKFQVPSLCDTIITQEYIQTIDLSNLSTARQGTGNGNSGIWTFTGSIQTIGDSKILNVGSGLGTVGGPDLIISGKHYKFCWDNAALCPGQVMVLVGYKSYSDDTSADYDVLDTVTPAGDGCFEFTAARNYTRLGWIIEGECGEVSVASFDGFSLQELHDVDSPAHCPVFCIRDLEGNHIADIEDTETSGENIIYTVDWAGLGIEPGCYKICLCEGDVYSENLFTDGDNGTMEANITGLSGGMAGSKQSPGYEGLYSFKGSLDTGLPSTTLMTHSTELELERNTVYKASARVYIDVANNAGLVNSAKRVDIILNGFTGSDIISRESLVIYEDNQEWIEVNVIFETASTLAGSRGFIEVNLITGNSPTGTVTLPASVDKVLVYEYSGDYCSQTFNLRESQDCTLAIEYTNDHDAFGFVYPDGFSFFMRIEGFLETPKYPETRTNFADSSGDISQVYAETSKIYSLSTRDLPEYLLDTLRLALIHNTVLIDGLPYVKQSGDVAPVWRKNSMLAPVTIEIESNSQSLKNSNC